MRIVTSIVTLWAAAGGLHSETIAKPVALSRSNALRGGTVVREILQVVVERGSTRIEAASGNRQVATFWTHRYNLVRRVQGGGSEEVDVREHVCAAGNATGMNVVAPPLDAGPLSNKTLRVRRRATGPELDLKDGKPTPQQQSCLLDLGFAAGLLDIIPLAIGTQPRQVGESWKLAVQNPRGKAYGIPVLKDVGCTLVSVEERPDGPHAQLSVSGSFIMQRPMGFNAAIEVSFAATITRRLADMMDVEMRITGLFKNTYAASYIADANAKPERATFIQELPYTLTRTLKLEPK